MSSADTPEARPTARLIGKLTTVSVRQARLRGLYGDGGGLFLQVSPNGAKSWVFRFKKDGRLRVMGLAPCTRSAWLKHETEPASVASCGSTA
jgi:hypothetical protein